jgi:hypothetical protein
MIRKEMIKCGNIDHGVYLLDDIKKKLNTRYLSGGIGVIDEITSDGKTWITVLIRMRRDNFAEHLIVQPYCHYVRGLVAGILIWSGVEVI